MFKILIVDDEPFEREGVKFLIDKYGLELEVYEADSGERALVFMMDNPVDILFTDIRMKGMDGLDMAAELRSRNMPIKVIFMSAYGEFEYAQRAIDLKAIRYILKPVEVEEFLRVVKQVIQLCEDERQAKEQQSRMEEAYRSASHYMKQKVLSNLIMGDRHLPEQPHFPIEGATHVRLILLDSRNRFFDMLDQDFERRLGEVIRRDFEVAHLNEFQTLLVVEADTEQSREQLTEKGTRLISWFRETYGGDVSVVIGGPVDDAGQLYSQFHQLESMLEYKFFYEEGTVLLAFPQAAAADSQTAHLEEALEELKQSIGRSRFDSAKQRFEGLFGELQNSEHVSVTYIKYLCTEIVKAVFDASAKKNADTFKLNLERIYKAAKLSDLKRIVLDLMEEQESQQLQQSTNASTDGMPKKVIETVVAMIEKEYGTDLSLELLAERVYLTPSYLSHLFKKHKGISFNKYLTIYRMEKTKELLLTTNRKIIDISQEVGYGNFPYFSSLFKNHYGKTPSQFREETAL
ncbi:response regulator transcription factor [Paenibacillus silvisoli]|uniref:response regulator transcription factor n=1 Tax=Paenibacillus silvisoli TaxID=3110539 RepID=UPI002805CDB9|nr:response regulator [Paenibacillus silvisoli]